LLPTPCARQAASQCSSRLCRPVRPCLGAGRCKHSMTASLAQPKSLLRTLRKAPRRTRGRGTRTLRGRGSRPLGVQQCCVIAPMGPAGPTAVLRHLALSPSTFACPSVARAGGKRTRAILRRRPNQHGRRCRCQQRGRCCWRRRRNDQLRRRLRCRPCVAFLHFSIWFRV